MVPASNPFSKKRGQSEITKAEPAANGSAPAKTVGGDVRMTEQNDQASDVKMHSTSAANASVGNASGAKPPVAELPN